MKSSSGITWWVLNPVTCIFKRKSNDMYPYKSKSERDLTQRRRRENVTTKADIDMMWPQLWNAYSQKKLQETKNEFSSMVSKRECGPASTLMSDFWPPDCENTFPLF